MELISFILVVYLYLSLFAVPVRSYFTQNTYNMYTKRKAWLFVNSLDADEQIWLCKQDNSMGYLAIYTIRSALLNVRFRE